MLGGGTGSIATVVRLLSAVDYMHGSEVLPTFREQSTNTIEDHDRSQFSKCTGPLPEQNTIVMMAENLQTWLAFLTSKSFVCANAATCHCSICSALQSMLNNDEIVHCVCQELSGDLSKSVLSTGGMLVQQRRLYITTWTWTHNTW